jgi:hypothetical protein
LNSACEDGLSSRVQVASSVLYLTPLTQTLPKSEIGPTPTIIPERMMPPEGGGGVGGDGETLSPPLLLPPHPAAVNTATTNTAPSLLN